MSESIAVAIISGAITLVGVLASYKSATNKVQTSITTQQVVMQAEMSSLKEDVKEHNHYAKLFAESMPVVQEQIKVINHRLKDLENRKGC